MNVDGFTPVLAGLEAWALGFMQRLPFFLAGLLVFGVFYFLARLARHLVRAGGRHLDPSLSQMLATLAWLGLVIFGLMAALWIAVPTFSFANIFTSLGVTGLILGFTLKDILENFVAGILILWRRPFQVGDQILSGTYEGTVAEINFRSTVLKTYDGVKVYIPNGKVFTEPLENKTGYPERRTTVTLGIDQGASVTRARDVIMLTLRETDGVLQNPAPEVFLDEVADFTNNLHVRYWTQPPTRTSELATRSLVTERLYEALQEAGISFPYPIQTVHLQRLEGGAPPPAGGKSQAPRERDLGRRVPVAGDRRANPRASHGRQASPH